MNKTKNSKKRVWVGAVIGVILVSLLLFACEKNPDNPDETDHPSNKNTELIGTDDAVNSETEVFEDGSELQGTESDDAQKNDAEKNDTEKYDTEKNDTETNILDKEDIEETEETKDTENTSTPSNPSNSQKPGESTEISTDTEEEPPASEEDTKQEPVDSENQESSPVTKEYTVNVFSQGGHCFYNVKINVYADETMTESVATASTNRSGKATLKLVSGKDYVFTISNVPKGYQVNNHYSFRGRSALVILNSSLVTEETVSGTALKVGDVMYDLTLSNAKGGEITLSKILKEKEMVMINFWYVNCTFCVKEFPAMSEAYNQYKDDIEIIAVTPFDSMNAIQTFLIENPLPFEVATCPLSLPENFGVSAYPVSVIIDKYGVIREIETGAILETDGFITLFDKYN